MPAPGFASLSGLQGPESCGGRRRGSGRSSNRSLTRSEIKEALRSATGELVADMMQEITNKVQPLIPPEGSPMAIGASHHRVQANHLVAGLTHTLGRVRSRPMPTPSAVPRSPFVPRTAQPPYKHFENSTRAELDQLGLTALRAMVDVEPYGSSDLGGDPADDEMFHPLRTVTLRTPRTRPAERRRRRGRARASRDADQRRLKLSPLLRLW